MITGSVLVAFASSWALLAFLTKRWTDQPQRWAAGPTTAMAAAAAIILILAPTGNELGWVWPPAIRALLAWMIIQSRRKLRSRARVFVLYPVFAALALSALVLLDLRHPERYTRTASWPGCSEMFRRASAVTIPLH